MLISERFFEAGVLRELFEYAVRHAWKHQDPSYANLLLRRANDCPKDIRRSIINALKECLPHKLENHTRFSKQDASKKAELALNHLDTLVSNWSQLPNTLVPRSDNRYRAQRSLFLWVASRTVKDRKLSTFGIQDSIERVPQKVDGITCVRYRKKLYRVHPLREFTKYLDLGIKGEIHLFSNEHGISGGLSEPEEFARIARSEFIFEDDLYEPTSQARKCSW